MVVWPNQRMWVKFIRPQKYLALHLAHTANHQRIGRCASIKALQVVLLAVPSTETMPKPSVTSFVIHIRLCNVHSHFVMLCICLTLSMALFSVFCWAILFGSAYSCIWTYSMTDHCVDYWSKPKLLKGKNKQTGRWLCWINPKYFPWHILLATLSHTHSHMQTTSMHTW